MNIPGFHLGLLDAHWMLLVLASNIMIHQFTVYRYMQYARAEAASHKNKIDQALQVTVL